MGSAFIKEDHSIPIFTLCYGGKKCNKVKQVYSLSEKNTQISVFHCERCRKYYRVFLKVEKDLVLREQKTFYTSRLSKEDAGWDML